MQGEGGEGCLGTKLTSSLQKGDFRRMGREGKCDLGRKVSALDFSHDNCRLNTGQTLAGSRIPHTLAGYLNNPADLTPSMEEVIWKQSSTTTSIP